MKVYIRVNWIIAFFMIILSILYLITSNAVTMRRDKSIIFSRITIIVMVLAILINLNSYNYLFFENEIGLFGGLFTVTANTHIFQGFMLLLTALILQLSSFFPRKILVENLNYIFNRKALTYKNDIILNKMSEQYRVLEYPLIILFIVVGGTFLLASYDLISIFISIELQSYGLYILCAVYKNSERSVNGAIMYFLLGGLSSCFILLGSALLYGNSGSTSFDSIHVINNIHNSFYENEIIYSSYYINFSLVILVVGLLFKISAAPFHFWSPDVYDSIPTIVTTFVAIFTKISILLLLLNLIKTNYTIETTSWTFTIIVSSLLSLIIGSVLGLTQKRIKRLYAYSTISHLGFILLAIYISNIDSTQSFVFYITQYSVSNLNAFLILLLMGNFLYIYKEKYTFNPYELLDKKNSPVQLVSQLRGFFHLNSYLSLSLAITIFSFVGIPPLIGFFGKQMILVSAIDSGYLFISIVAILTSVISAYYYLMIIRQMFFDEPNYYINSTLKEIKLIDANNNKSLYVDYNSIKLSSNLSFTVSVITLVMTFFIIWPEEWLNIIKILAITQSS